MIGFNPDLPGRIDDLNSVAATEIKYIVVKERVENLDRLANAAVPLLRAFASQGLTADVIVIGLVIVDRMLRQFEM